LQQSHKLEALLQSLAITGKENDRRTANKHPNKAMTQHSDPNSEKSLAILNQASGIIKYLQTYVDSGEMKALKRDKESKVLTRIPAKTKDQATYTEFDTVKLRFEASFDSIRSDKNELSEPQSNMVTDNRVEFKEERKCHQCEHLQDKLIIEIEQKTYLEDVIEEIQKEILVKNRQTQSLELHVDRIKDEVTY
jgi:hypothetical protein